MSRTTRTEAVTRVLREEVLRGQYRPGERLPSERDLATRFRTTRGVVRVALKKLEQLGVADVQPGGARVQPLSEATLEAIGHLLELDQELHPDLVDHILEMLGALMAASTRIVVERGRPADLARARDRLEQIVRPELSGAERQRLVQELSHVFLEANDNLVMGIARRSLRTELVARLRGAGLSLDPDYAGLPASVLAGRSFPNRQILPQARALARAIDQRDGLAAYEAAHQIWTLFRRHVRKTLEARP